MSRTRRYVAGTVTAIALAVGIAVGAPAANAAGGITIYPNISDSRCGWGGTVQQVQIAAVPGNSKNWTADRWVALQVPRNTPVKIIANVRCSSWGKSGGKYVKVEGTVASPKANTSYWF